VIFEAVQSVLLFISLLLNDAVIISDCIASNIGKMIDYKGEGCESKLLRHDLEHYCTFA
jgi:hypothetical protein